MHTVCRYLSKQCLYFQEHDIDPQEGFEVVTILEKTRNRNNFGGIVFTANFATSYAPFSWVDSESNVKGVFKDTLEIIAEKLNLTFVLKKSNNENLNVWFKK